jgi:hypothetical protein
VSCRRKLVVAVPRKDLRESGTGNGVALFRIDGWSGKFIRLSNSIANFDKFGCLQYFINNGGTLTGVIGGILNLGALSPTVGFMLPKGAGAAPTADGQFAFDTTTHLPVAGSNGLTLHWPNNLSGATNQWVIFSSRFPGMRLPPLPTDEHSVTRIGARSSARTHGKD